MNRKRLLMSYAPLADFIARMNGDHCEVLIHDVRDPDHSILYVTQPSLTNRHPGNGMTEYAVEMIRGKRYLREPFVVNYVGGTEERLFRSSTFFIRDGEELAGLLCVNVDVSNIVEGIDSLLKALILDPTQMMQKQEIFHFGSSMEDRIEAIFQRFLNARDINEMTTNEKRQLVHELRRDGVFEVKGKVSEIAKRLDVSEKTIYRYLKTE